MLGGILAACAVPPYSQPAADTIVEVNADTAQLSVLHDLLSAAVRWSPGESVACLDPVVASYPAPGVRPSLQRWSDAVLGELLGDSAVRVDSTAGRHPPGSRTCARSSRLYRFAYGLPRLADDAGSVVAVASRLDSRGNADTAMFDYRLVRRKGVWVVDGWLADSQTVHNYVRGDGCYRLSHPPFVSGIRVDTMVIRAEPFVTGTTWNSFPRHRLVAGPSQVDVVGPDGDNQVYWYVSHDSVHFVWAGWPASIFVDLLLEADSLRGSMHMEYDYTEPDPPTVAVTGRKVACPS